MVRLIVCALALLLVALTHANFALAYMHIARSAASDAQIEADCGVRMHDFSSALHGYQSRAIRAIAATCPQLAPADSGVEALQTGWMPA